MKIFTGIYTSECKRQSLKQQEESASLCRKDNLVYQKALFGTIVDRRQEGGGGTERRTEKACVLEMPKQKMSAKNCKSNKPYLRNILEIKQA